MATALVAGAAHVYVAGIAAALIASTATTATTLIAYTATIFATLVASIATTGTLAIGPAYVRNTVAPLTLSPALAAGGLATSVAIIAGLLSYSGRGNL